MARQNKARLLFVHILSEANRPFLMRLQARKPLIHELLPRCVELFINLAQFVLLDDKIPENASEIAALNLKDSNIFKSPSDAGYMRTLGGTLEGLDKEGKAILAKEFLSAMKEQLLYLQTHLPFKNKLLQCVVFADPSRRTDPRLTDRANIVANIFRRFGESEKAKIVAQLAFYKSVPADQLPEFDEVKDRVDHWWRKVFQVLEEKMSEAPLELIRLVKLTLSLPHGQAGVESGFSNSKSIIENRESLSMENVKSQKMVQGLVRRAGGAHNVPITAAMLSKVRSSYQHYKKELEEEREKKRKAEEDANAAAELKKKKEEYEAEKKTWDDEKAQLKTKIKAVEESINWAKKESKAAITRGLRTDDNKVKDTCFKQVGECETRIADLSEQLSSFQRKLAKVCERKPKGKE